MRGLLLSPNDMVVEEGVVLCQQETQHTLRLWGPGWGGPLLKSTLYIDYSG